VVCDPESSAAGRGRALKPWDGSPLRLTLRWNSLRGMNALNAFDMSDLKRIYRVLHAQLTRDLELLDSEFLSQLQTHLQHAATTDGVDVGMHADWDRWLKDEEPTARLSLVKES